MKVVLFIFLLVSLIYSAGMWLLMAYHSWQLDRNGAYTARKQEEIELYTFHLGLCALLAGGFLYVGANL